MSQQIVKEPKIAVPKILDLPALAVPPFVSEKQSGKDVKIPNKDFKRESFEEVLSSLKSTKKADFEIYAGYKETAYFPKLIESLARIATNSDYKKITGKSFDYQEAAKEVLINFLGLVPGKHLLSKEIDTLIKASFDQKNDLETNKAILYALARKKEFSSEDQKFIFDILNDTKNYKEDLRQVAASALGLSIVENFQSEKFGLNYLQDQIKSLKSNDVNYLYKVKYLTDIIKKISIYIQPDALANYQEGKLTAELSNKLFHPENTRESLVQLLDATTRSGINKKNHLLIKKNFEKCLELLEDKNCKVPENERLEIKKSLKAGINVIDRIFINPQLPPPRPRGPEKIA